MMPKKINDYYILPLDYLPSLWHGTVLWRTITRWPLNIQLKGFLPSYGMDRSFRLEKLKEQIFKLRVNC